MHTRIVLANLEVVITNPTSASLPPASQDRPVYLAVDSGFTEH